MAAGPGGGAKSPGFGRYIGPLPSVYGPYIYPIYAPPPEEPERALVEVSFSIEEEDHSLEVTSS